MATYFFETITATQALNYAAATDQLVFTNATSTANKVSAVYTPSALSAVTITDLVTGRAVAFGTGIYNEGSTTNGVIVFPDSSNLYVGSLGNDTNGGGSTALGDGIFGGDGADTLSGAGGGDLIQANGGDDSLDGGTGSDTL